MNDGLIIIARRVIVKSIVRAIEILQQLATDPVSIVKSLQ